MAKLKTNDIKKMNESERMKKIEEMKLELVKAKVSAVKSGSSKAREIKKTIARILTINNKNKQTENINSHQSRFKMENKNA